MVWKLFIAVLALQVSCLHADGHGEEEFNLTRMLLRIAASQQQGMGQDDKEPEPIEMLHNYIEEKGFKADEDPVRTFVRNILEAGEYEADIYKQIQASDLITKAILENIFEDERGVNDFAKDLLMKQIRGAVSPAGDNKIIMGMLFDHLLNNPKSEHREIIMHMLYRVTSQLSPEDKSMVRVMMLQLMYRTYGEQKELVVELFYALMTDDLGGREMETTEILMLLVQHLMNRLPFDSEKKAVGLMIMHGLTERDDHAAQAALREFVGKIIYAGSSGDDIEEDDLWKFLPPGPCLVKNGDVTLMEHDCPNDYACDVGPVSSVFEGRSLTYWMCRFPDDLREYAAFHACELKYPNGYVDERPNCLGMGNACDFGPFAIDYEDGIYEAKFCTDYNNYTFDVSTYNPVLYYACSLTDVVSNFVSLQRRCPTGYTCRGVPQSLMLSDIPHHAQVCHKSYEHDEDMMFTIVNTVLGYPEEDDDSMMMGGERVANMSSGDSNFETYVITELAKMMMDDDDDDEDMGPRYSYQEQKDLMSWKVLQFLVEKVKPDDSLLMKLLSTLETRFYLGITSDADRVLLRAVIAHMIPSFYEMQESEEGRNGDDVRALLQLLHMDDHDNINMMFHQHAKHHEALESKIQEGFQKIMSHIGVESREEDSGENRESDSGESNEHGYGAKVLERLFEELYKMDKK